MSMLKLHLKQWKGLASLEKIQIVKTFIMQTFLSKPSIISVLMDLIKEINKMIYGFIWKGNDEIKRTALINATENGDLRYLTLSPRSQHKELWL